VTNSGGVAVVDLTATLYYADWERTMLTGNEQTLASTMGKLRDT